MGVGIWGDEFQGYTEERDLLEHDALDGGDDGGKVVDELLTADFFCHDDEDGVVAGQRANHGGELVGIDVGSQSTGIAGTRMHHGHISGKVNAHETGVAEELRHDLRTDRSLVEGAFGQHIAITFCGHDFHGAHFVHVARERGLRHNDAVAFQFLEDLSVTAHGRIAQEYTDDFQTFESIVHLLYIFWIFMDFGGKGKYYFRHNACKGLHNYAVIRKNVLLLVQIRFSWSIYTWTQVLDSELAIGIIIWEKDFGVLHPDLLGRAAHAGFLH